MLVNLTIRNIVLAEQIDIEFSGGLSVLTGETGAGKSILLDALALALGARGDGGLVRKGAERGQVTAAFAVGYDHDARAAIRKNDLTDADTLLMRRIQQADGRSRAFINDTPVSNALLREVGASLVEIHGQNEVRALSTPLSHLRLVDAYGGLEETQQALRSVYRRLSAITEQLDSHAQSSEAAAKELMLLQATVDELETLNAQRGEADKLDERRRLMMQAEQIFASLDEACEALEGTASPIPELASLSRRMERKREGLETLLAEPLEALGQAIDRLEDARAGFSSARMAISFDPSELEQCEERLFSLRAAARKYQCQVDALGEELDNARQKVKILENHDTNVRQLEQEKARLQEEYQKQAEALSSRRIAAGNALADAVMQEFPALKLALGQFKIAQTTDQNLVRPHGFDQIEFQAQMNPGAGMSPLLKSASGGELSRVILALKVSLADCGSAPTLVFDEADSGLGGAVSDAVGRRMARLASRLQILTVTHAPQIAARADSHFVISKLDDSKASISMKIQPVAGDERREEIARMLAGAQITQEARAAAQALIDESRQET